MPSEKRIPIPANIEADREYPARDREWLERLDAVVVGVGPVVILVDPDRRNGQLSVDVRGSSRLLLGTEKLEFNQKRLSVSKGTREAQSSRVITRIMWTSFLCRVVKESVTNTLLFPIVYAWEVHL